MRVFVPATLDALRSLGEENRLPGPLQALAVTAELRADLAGLGEEELEYAVTTAAAESSYSLLAGAGHRSGRRVVVVAEVDDTAVEAEGSAGAVRVLADVVLTRVAAVLADPDEVDLAAPPEEDLAWYGTQEIADLLA